MLLRSGGPHFSMLLREVLFRQLRGTRKLEFLRLVSVDRLQFFPRLEAYSPSWRNGHFSSRPRIAPDACLPRTHVEYAKASQFNAIARSQRLLHTLEDGFDG